MSTYRPQRYPRRVSCRLPPYIASAVVAAIALVPGLLGCCDGGGAGSPDLSRYPRRVPEWLWRDPRHDRLIPPPLRAEIDQDLRRLESMRAFGETPAVLRKERQVARKLAAALAPADLCQGATVITDEERGLALAVQIDPTFDEQARRTLIEASRRFVRHALDEGVIERSLAASARAPADRHASSRTRPRDAASFRAHLRPALSPRDAVPALLVISRYSGNAWWGGAKLNFFHDPTYHLARLPPPRGYLYLRLNADKLRPAEPHGQDPAFWAGKIGHEVLHNVGYSHPRYEDPADRDEENQESRRAFVIAYEAVIRERAMCSGPHQPRDWHRHP